MRLKQPIALYPQSGSKERWMFVLSCLSHSHAVQGQQIIGQSLPQLGLGGFLTSLNDLDTPSQTGGKTCFHGESKVHH